MIEGALSMASADIIMKRQPRQHRYPGRYGPFWGQPENPRTKRIKAAQKRARKATRKNAR